MSETVKSWFVICDSCNAHFPDSPTNSVEVADFIYCPNCGSKLIGPQPREIEHELGWTHPKGEDQE